MSSFNCISFWATDLRRWVLQGYVVPERQECLHYRFSFEYRHVDHIIENLALTIHKSSCAVVNHCQIENHLSGCNFWIVYQSCSYRHLVNSYLRNTAGHSWYGQRISLRTRQYLGHRIRNDVLLWPTDAKVALKDALTVLKRQKDLGFRCHVLDRNAHCRNGLGLYHWGEAGISHSNLQGLGCSRNHCVNFKCSWKRYSPHTDVTHIAGLKLERPLVYKRV